MRKSKEKSSKIILLVLLIVYFFVAYSVMNHYNISCVFKEIFGVPCPGCGMTRAFLSLMKLDIYGAFRHNIVIFFIPYVFMYVFFNFKHKIHNVFLSIIAAITIINWAIKIVIFV